MCLIWLSYSGERADCVYSIYTFLKDSTTHSYQLPFFCVVPPHPPAPPGFLFNGNFQFSRSLLGNTPKQRAKPIVYISLCDKEHVGSILHFFLSVLLQYSSLLLPAVVSLVEVCYSAPHFTSCSYLNIFICSALEEWGWGMDMFVHIY